MARAANAPAVVIAMQGAPFDDEPKDRESFEPFLTALRRMKPRGSTDRADRAWRPPSVHRGSAAGPRQSHPARSAGLTDVGWVRVTIAARCSRSVCVREAVIPRWKYW